MRPPCLASALPLTFLALLLLGPPAAALELTSISPASAAAGSSVTIRGQDLGPEVVVLLGNDTLSPASVTENALTLVLPPLEEGVYAVSLRRGEEVSGRYLPLTIVAPVPQILSLTPSNIDQCADASEREITIFGRFFDPAARVLVDEASVAASVQDDRQVAFTPPALPGGNHRVQVVNPSGRQSQSRAFVINSIPAIHAVRTGADHVTAYEVIIEGKNFLYDSQLAVNGQPVTGLGTLNPRQETVEYLDCNTLLYMRRPYSGQPKRVSLQVVNPGGQQSPVFHATMP